MERVMSVEDKIRRAEEIYYRRKNQEIPIEENKKNINEEKKKVKYIKKMIRQIIICLIIYCVFYTIINNNYVFSEDFTNKAKEILLQDINFYQIYLNIINNVKQGNTKNDDIQEKQVEQEIEAVQTSQIEQTIPEAQEKQEETLSQMEQDANYIKNTIEFIKPVNGIITSTFGLRNPTTASVPRNHTGTDIATSIGTKIISATDGTVVLKSSEGDYGNHIKIQIKDVIILYAHCNKLYVNKGDIIKQGQEIGEVGTTGNVTGSHLHFEIIYQDRYIDPQLIVQL